MANEAHTTRTFPSTAPARRHKPAGSSFAQIIWTSSASPHHDAVNRHTINNTMTSQFTRYLLTSIIALGIDLSVFITCTWGMGVNAILSAALGFAGGVATNYGLSAIWVFPTRTKPSFGQFAWFAIIGVAGLGLTEMTISLGIFFGYDSLPAKIASIVIVFVWNYTLRKALFSDSDSLQTHLPALE